MTTTLINNSKDKCFDLLQVKITKSFSNLWCLIIPCLLFIEINLIGRLFVTEIVLLCQLPILLYFRAKWLSRTLPSKLIIFALLWLSAQILTDVIRGTPFEDWSRGWSKITFFMLNFVAIYLLIVKRQVSIILFYVGIAASQILSFYISPNIYAVGEPWKFGVGPAITMFIVLISQASVFRRMYYGTEIIIGVAAAANLLFGSRSQALICFATIVYVSANRHASKLRGASNLSRWNFIKIVILSIGVGLISVQIYDYAALNGWLSEKSTRKYLQQSSGKYGVLLSGRTEFLASSVAISDSPIIGHGSWAKNPKYQYIIAYFLSELEYENPHTYIREDDLIPSHSYLFGAWVESGIIGAAFWGWVWFLVLNTLVTLYNARDKLLPLVAFTCFNMLWSILFSPFGAENRIYVAYNLVLIIFVLTRVTSMTQSEKMRLT